MLPEICGERAMPDCAAARLRLVLFAVVISTVILPSRNTSAQSSAAAGGGGWAAGFSKC